MKCYFLGGVIKNNNNIFRYFTIFELALWSVSIITITTAFVAVNSNNYLSLIASLIGSTALIFVSKANVIGQILTVVFSIFYGIISFIFGYYGEMITYLCMTAPIAMTSIITWLKNPSKENKRQVAVNHIVLKEWCFLFALAVVISIIFYFILQYFNTVYLSISTLSVFTSFIACYLTMRRSEYYAIGYAANDIVLIILWVLATMQNIGYLSMVICFVIFLINDTYGFFNWRKIKKNQFAKTKPLTNN